jgi:hypothetical protein
VAVSHLLVNNRHATWIGWLFSGLKYIIDILSKKYMYFTRTATWRMNKYISKKMPRFLPYAWTSERFKFKMIFFSHLETFMFIQLFVYNFNIFELWYINGSNLYKPLHLLYCRDKLESCYMCKKYRFVFILNLNLHFKEDAQIPTLCLNLWEVQIQNDFF